jgi:Heterokaryon incompatibility protein (HET)
MFEIVLLLTGTTDGALSRMEWTKHRPLFADPSSEDAQEFLAERLRICTEKHDQCRRKDTVSPTRLLDVGYPLRIVEPAKGKNRPKFIFLSACWGRDFALRLTRNNFAQLQKEITLDVLPKTIRDAISVTRALQIPYIWVDSLCIVQDDFRDWEVEAARLKGYLENCILTLGAASSPALATGFLSFRDDQRCYTFNAQTVGSLPGAKLHLRPSLPPVWDALSRDPLLTRLWTLQELTICTRSVLFGSSRIVWNCRTTMVSDASEAEMTPIWDTCLGLDVLLAASATSEYEKSLIPSKDQDPTVYQSLASLWSLDTPIYNAWHKIVEYSSRLKVTFERDRLPALSALVAITGEKLHNDMYIAGLWRNNLHRDLLWHRADAPLQKTAGSAAPSWSWAAYTGRISYSRLHSERYSEPDLDHVTSREASIVSVQWKGKDPNPFGEVQSACIYMNSLCIGYDELAETVERIEGVAQWLVQMDMFSETSLENTKSSLEPPEAQSEIAKDEQEEETAYQVEAIKRTVKQPAQATNDEQPPRTSHLTVVWISSSYSKHWFVINTLVVEPGEQETSRRVGIGTLYVRMTMTENMPYFDFNEKAIRLV